MSVWPTGTEIQHYPEIARTLALRHRWVAQRRGYAVLWMCREDQVEQTFPGVHLTLGPNQLG
jgi:hypothetical protein